MSHRAYSRAEKTLFNTRERLDRELIRFIHGDGRTAVVKATPKAQGADRRTKRPSEMSEPFRVMARKFNVVGQLSFVESVIERRIQEWDAVHIHLLVFRQVIIKSRCGGCARPGAANEGVRLIVRNGGGLARSFQNPTFPPRF